jgi:hypothetical protein
MGITCISITTVHIPVYFSHALSKNNTSFESINQLVTQLKIICNAGFLLPGLEENV